MNKTIQTSQGYKYVQLSQINYNLKDILNLSIYSLNILMSIFDVMDLYNLLIVMYSNQILSEINGIQLNDPIFQKLVKIDQQFLLEKYQSVFGPIDYADIIINLYHNTKILQDFNIVDQTTTTESNLPAIEIKDIPISYPIKKSLPKNLIISNRKLINKRVSKQLFGGNSNPVNLNPSDIKYITDLYDTLYFNGNINKLLKQQNCTLEFGISTATQSAGFHRKKGCVSKIAIAWPVFKNLFKNNNVNESYESNGIRCYNRLECIQLTLEHELIHLLIRLSPEVPKIIKKRDRIYSPHGLLFKDLARAYFGHTGVTHSFNINVQNLLSKSDFNLNEIVYFESGNKGTLRGKIIKLNPKRARVEINGGNNRYDVYYSVLNKYTQEIE